MDFLFSDALTVDTLDKVPENFRALYEEDKSTGHFKLSQDERTKAAVASITGFQGALKAVRLELKNKTGDKVDLTPLVDYGTTPEEIASGVKAKMEELTVAAAGSKEAKLNLDKVKETLAQGHAKELQVKDGRIDALKTQLDRLMVHQVANSAITELKGDVDLLMPHLVGHIQSVEEDGNFNVYVVDPLTKDRRFSPTTALDMSIKELVTEFKSSEKYSKLFASEAPKGGGMPPGSAQGTKGLPAQKQELSAVEKIAKGLKDRQK